MRSVLPALTRSDSPYLERLDGMGAALRRRGCGKLTSVTAQPWTAPPRSRGRFVEALIFMIAPLPLAVLLLVAGLFGSLVWVCLSITVSVLWLPLLVVGIVLLVRRISNGWRFTPPPGWPPPPPGWSPPAGWQPDASWPPPPDDWRWWERR